MNKISFSCSVIGLSVTLVLSAYPTSAAAQPAPARKSITLLTPAELASLRRGFAQMIAWNSAPRGSANFKRSLAYWANMHAYFGNGCANPSGLTAQGMSGLSAQSPTTPDERSTWCTCEHGSVQFLTWHRMYLFYFERVLQSAAGDPRLRLPFWDYQTNRRLPAAYRARTYVNSAGQTVRNPLFVASRQARLNDGTGTLTAAVVSTTGAMGATSYTSFNNAIEQTPHGAVHCATGVSGCPTGYMGAVPAAANDPIFYSHHANIDRLYECWLRVSPAQRRPTGAILNATFSFIDGAGNLVTRRVSDMTTVQQLGYSYAAGGGCPRIVGTPALTQDRAMQVIPLLGPMELQPGTTTVPLRLAPELRARGGRGVTSGGQSIRPATIVLEDVAVDGGAMVEVALQGPNGRRLPIGVINAFNETAPRHEGMAPAGRKAFDATAALQALGGSTNARLVLQPTTGVSGGVGLAAEVPRVGVRFSAVRIELR